MKKVILILIAISMILAFTGCGRLTPSVAATVAQMYDTTKTIYVKGQEIVVINSDLLDEETLKQLNKIDETVKKIDTVFTASDAERYEALKKEFIKLQSQTIKNNMTVSRLKEITEILDSYDRMKRTMEVIEK
jgi:glucosamine 6-phosphate synthetase-like amidotransferase/phosphosugar isomerase protein